MNRMDFDTWLHRIDVLISNTIGLGRDDLPDKPYDEWFESGMTAREAATTALRSEGFPL